MLLRRITKHVKDQNWFAVALDFFIVVIGVFIGIQVANWNTQNADQIAYEYALERLKTEVNMNLAMLDTNYPSIEEKLEVIRQAQTALKTCRDDPKTKDAVNAGVLTLAGTAGLHLRQNVIEELTDTRALLARQSPAARERFADLMFFVEFAENDARYSEVAPLEWRPETIPSVGIGEHETIKYDYFGMQYSTKRPPLILAVPVSKACTDSELVKALWTWERHQSYIPILMLKLSAEYEETLDLIERELN